MEDSIPLAVDTGISFRVITNDLNYNMMNDVIKWKMSSVCQQFSFEQCINEPTHFIETSCSLIVLILVSDKRYVISCGVGDPFLSQEIRFHCPVYCAQSFSKPKTKSIERQVWYWDSR